MIYPKFYNQEATGAKPKLEINFEKQNPVWEWPEAFHLHLAVIPDNDYNIVHKKGDYWLEKVDKGTRNWLYLNETLG